MGSLVGGFVRGAAVVACGLFLLGWTCYAQPENEPGHSIGKVSINQDLIILELEDGALGKANLFDLNDRTLRFTPMGSKYKVETLPLHWDSNYGPEFVDAEVPLHNFTFPFSGESWKSFRVGTTGSIRFGPSEEAVGLDPYGRRDGGIILDRFDQLAEAADKLVEKGPAICVFLKPRLSGPHYVSELSDRVVITWDLTESFGGLLDFTWFKTVNRFQAVLKSDGSIEMSYKELAAKDAIVGVYTRGGKPAAVHFSSLSSKDGPFTDVFESFHYLGVPKPQDLSCSIIKALGDKFDFLAYYSDFRIDTQEGSPPSDGPIGGKVTGIGQTQHDLTKAVLDSRCTQGRFQLGFAEPVYVGANEMQERPPEGAPVGGSHDIGFYLHQLADEPQNVIAYNYAVGHLGHEVGHRWSAYVSAKVKGKPISLTNWPHWSPGVQANVAFPYSQAAEASTLGGGVWQDNLDGTYTQIRDGFFVPATGYSYLDLYLMGLVSPVEVPDFFVLTDLVPIGEDKDGHRIFRAERMNVTIQEVIAAEGPRLPDVYHSQRKFNTGIVVVVEHGKQPSPELVKQANGIRQQWIKYWDKTTGYRASMTANPR